jgi:hypothetical protein
MSKIEITSDGTGAGTDVYLDEKKLDNLRYVSLAVTAGGLTSVTMTFNSLELEVETAEGNITTEIDGKEYELKPI